MACPTRIAPALATPKAGMNATELTWTTAMSAATLVVPSPATTTFVKNEKARNSRNQFAPEGRPNRSSLMSSPRRSAPLPPRRRPSATKTARSPRNATPLARALARAEPRTPIAGAPRCPSMRTQFKATLSTMAVTLARMGSPGLPSPP